VALAALHGVAALASGDWRGCGGKEYNTIPSTSLKK